MKIVHLVAGAGGMYCGSCMQGNTLAAAMQQAGHDVMLVPVYTPLRTDEPNVGERRVAFGGLNVFLQQQSGLMRRAPRFLDRVLDHPALLGRLGGSTQPKQLGPLTVSMLRGEQGHQQKELDKLIAWLDAEVQPEVIHLSTALLAGSARMLAERFDVPIVCTLSGEDTFIEQLPEPYRTGAHNELRERCAELSALVAPSEYYARFMAEYLDVPPERITVIRPGLDLEGHVTETKPACDPLADEPLTIGYFSRICPAKGLHQLAEAFRLLVRGTPGRLGMSGFSTRPVARPIRLMVAGYLDRANRGYLRQIRRQLASRGLADRFKYVGPLDRVGKIEFLRSIDILSVPATRPESKGLVALEAWANGTPAVLPDHGVFSELIAETGGGLVYEANRPTALANSLRQLIENPALAARCGCKAQETVHRDYDIRQTATRVAELYRTLVER